jgi:hypothetical protein
MSLWAIPHFELRHREIRRREIGRTAMPARFTRLTGDLRRERSLEGRSLPAKALR